MEKIKKGKDNKNFFKIVDLFIKIVFALLSILLIINIIRLSNIETLLRIVVIVILGIILLFLVLFKKKKLLCRIIMIIFCLLYGFLNYAFYRVFASLDSITENVDTKGICLVTYLTDLKSIDDITGDDIAIVGSDMDASFYEMAEDILEKEGLGNKFKLYDDYFAIINALLDKEIKYAFLPENYNDIYSSSSGEGEEKKDLNFKVLYTEQKVIKKEDVEVSTKMLDEPFTMLLMGTDVMLDSYNADTLMVLSVNPKTLKVTMLSIPRDTYTTIACSGGKHKINASGWYGDSCVVKTVSKYLGVDIDYYAKINFLGIVDLVNDLGGVEVDVPYAFCEQNSKRQFGSNMVYVDAGKQTLNGEQALALSRNRHYWSGMCPSKYTTDGERSDLTRGKNQQLVIKAILSKLMTVRDLSKFYDILDTVGNNMSTNMSKETILSFYNVGKNIVKKFNSSNADEIINIDRLALKSHFGTAFISGLHLSVIVNYKESVDYVANQMKKNLGIVKDTVVKKFSFDVNEEYNPEEVKFNKLTSNLSVLPNFVGKPLSEAISYCNKNGIKYESNLESGTIISQSISHNTDITTMKNKTIVFGIEDVVDNGKNNTNIDKNTNTDVDKDSDDDKADDSNNSSDESKVDDKDSNADSSEDSSSTNNSTGGNDNTPPSNEDKKDETVEPPVDNDDSNKDGGETNEED